MIFLIISINDTCCYIIYCFTVALILLFLMCLLIQGMYPVMYSRRFMFGSMMYPQKHQLLAYMNLLILQRFQNVYMKMQRMMMTYEHIPMLESICRLQKQKYVHRTEIESCKQKYMLSSSYSLDRSQIIQCILLVTISIPNTLSVKSTKYEVAKPLDFRLQIQLELEC